MACPAMSERLERLQREIAEEKAAALADLGLSFEAPVLLRANQTPAEVIALRLSRVPAMLRADATHRMRRAIVSLPWLSDRAISGTHA